VCFVTAPLLSSNGDCVVVLADFYERRGSRGFSLPVI